MDGPARDRWLAHADAVLRGAGLKVGAGRTAVVEHLAREGGCLLSAQEIAHALRERPEGASPATVYRTLDALHRLGLVHRFDSGDGAARFEVADPEGHHHHHLVDEDTGAVTAFEDEALERAIEALGERLGVELTGHDVIVRGRRAHSD